MWAEGYSKTQYADLSVMLTDASGILLARTWLRLDLPNAAFASNMDDDDDDDGELFVVPVALQRWGS